MAVIRPFRALRPAPELTSRVAALPYDVYNRREAKSKAAEDPLSFLNIDRPETQFPDDTDMYAPVVYDKAHEMLVSQIREGVYVRDEVPCYYLYELTMNGRSQTGLVACASIDDYLGDVIRRHENTRKEKEEDRVRHIDVTGAQTGPIFLAYRNNPRVSTIVSSCKKISPAFDFTSEDGIRHRGWVMDQEEVINQIRAAFAAVPTLYIADGHHRAASAVRVGLKRRQEAGNFTGEEEFNYFLSVLFPDDELMIMDYNRVVKDLAGMSGGQFLQELSHVCEVTKESGPVRPERKGEVGLFLSEGWFRLRFDAEDGTDPVSALDVSILQNRVLSPVLGIHDPTTDPRIDFVGGIRGLEELERRVHGDCKAAFSMYPTSISELFAVADEHRLMPPKSTWFEPKLRSGLFIHELQQGREEE